MGVKIGPIVQNRTRRARKNMYRKIVFRPTKNTRAKNWFLEANMSLIVQNRTRRVRKIVCRKNPFHENKK